MLLQKSWNTFKSKENNQSFSIYFIQGIKYYFKKEKNPGERGIKWYYNFILDFGSYRITRYVNLANFHRTLNLVQQKLKILLSLYDKNEEILLLLYDMKMKSEIIPPTFAFSLHMFIHSCTYMSTAFYEYIMLKRQGQSHLHLHEGQG